jgi:hypothetical protein
VKFLENVYDIVSELRLMYGNVEVRGDGVGKGWM